MTRVSRPPLRWFGGKWPLAKSIISHLPQHALYCEPYAGAASVLMQKPRAQVEVIGDMNHDLANLFFVLRDRGLSEILREQVELTPFSWHEFWLACEPVADADDLVERARRMVVRHAMGRAVDASVTSAYQTGFRDFTGDPARVPVADWMSWPQHVSSWRDRLRGVVIDCLPALTTMQRHDRPDALFYVDPPYLPETRKAKRRRYSHEMTVDEHVHLLEGLKMLEGMVALSGYWSALYDDLLPGWHCVEIRARDQGGAQRTECLWLSPNLLAQRARDNTLPLFTAA